MLPSTAFLVGLFLGLAMGGIGIGWMHLSRSKAVDGLRYLGSPVVDHSSEFGGADYVRPRDHHWVEARRA